MTVVTVVNTVIFITFILLTEVFFVLLRLNQPLRWSVTPFREAQIMDGAGIRDASRMRGDGAGGAAEGICGTRKIDKTT